MRLILFCNKGLPTNLNFVYKLVSEEEVIVNIISGHKVRAVVAILAAVLAGSAFGYWGYGEYRAYELRSEVTGLVKDTSLRLREALSVDPSSLSADNSGALSKLYDHAFAVDNHLKELRGMDAAPAGALADAADDYVLTGREILVRHASSQRIRLKLSGSLQVLQNHMRADDRTGSWVTQAVRAKEQVEEDYRDYRLVSNALSKLLESFPASQRTIAPHVDAALLIDESLVNEARQRVLDTFGQTAREIDKIANLNAYR